MSAPLDARALPALPAEGAPAEPAEGPVEAPHAAQALASPDPLARREDWALALCFLGCALLVAKASDAAILLAVPALALPVAGYMRWRGRKPKARSEAAIALCGGLLGALLGLETGSGTTGISCFLLVVLAVKGLAPRVDRDRSAALVTGLALLAVTAAEGLSPLLGVLLPVTLGAIGAALHYRARRFLGATDRLRDLARVSYRLNAEPPPTSAPNRVWVGAPSPRRRLAWVGVLLAISAFSLVVFLITPRIPGRWLGQRHSGIARLTGFGGDVDLDSIGRIRRNQALAFRVQVPAAASPDDDPYWRGACLNEFSEGRWQVSIWIRGHHRYLNDEREDGFYDPFVIPGPSTQSYVFHVEAIGTDSIFTPGEIQRVGFRGARPLGLVKDLGGAVRTRNLYSVPMTYEVACYPERAWGPDRPWQLVDRFRNACLEVPDELDRPRLQAYALQVLAGVEPGQEPARAAALLEAHLQQEFTYSLEGSPGGESPLETFIYERRRGHCELFASALVMLLRSVGIPARLITGFRGGEYNEFSQSYTVRQSMAHAWVEARIGSGWVRFDPTPPESREVSPALGRLQAAWDWIQLEWFAKVIAFDLRNQRALLDALQTWLREASPLLLIALGLGLTCGVGLLGRVGRGWLRRRRPRPVEAPPPPALSALLAALGTCGIRRRPGETLSELAERAEAARLEGVRDWSAAYNAHRFGSRQGLPNPDALLATLRASAAEREGQRADPKLPSPR